MMQPQVATRRFEISPQQYFDWLLGGERGWTFHRIQILNDFGSGCSLERVSGDGGAFDLINADQLKTTALMIPTKAVRGAPPE